VSANGFQKAATVQEAASIEAGSIEAGSIEAGSIDHEAASVHQR